MLPCSPEEFGDKRFLLKSIAYNATARSDMFTLPCSDEVRSFEALTLSSSCDLRECFCAIFDVSGNPAA